MQLDGAEAGPGDEIDDDDVASAPGQRQIEDQAVRRCGHRLDSRAVRDGEGAGLKRMCDAGRFAACQPAGDDRRDDAKTDDDDDPEDRDQDLQRSHLGTRLSPAAAGPDRDRGVTAELPPPSADGATAAVCAGAAEAGQRLDRMLALHLPAFSRMRLKRLIESGHVSCGGAVLRDPSRRVRCGQNFVVLLPEPEAAAPAPQPIALEIRYEDAHLIVVDKPAGLVVHPAPGHPDGTLVNALIAHCGAGLSGIGGVRRPGIVHRLDKDTSGLIVVAKTEAAHQALARDFAQRRIDRAYAAFVWGVPQPPCGEIVGNIGRHPANRKKMAVVGGGRGKPAVTRYRLERAFGSTAALIECRLATGRTHQIRVHLAHRGHPLIGDALYGARALRAAARGGPTDTGIAGFPRQALHARRLGFRHPAGGGNLEFESPLPADLHALFTALERL